VNWDQMLIKIMLTSLLRRLNQEDDIDGAYSTQETTWETKA